MPQTYQFRFVDAPIDTVWRVVFHEAEQNGSIVIQQEPRLIVIESQGVFSAYGLRQYPAMEGKTGVYLVMTHHRTAAVGLANASDLFQALESIPVDVAPDMYEGAKAHLEEIKTLVDEAMKDPSLDLSKRKNDRLKPSRDPNKAYEPASHSVFGAAVPVIRPRLAWVAFAFSLLAVFPVFGLGMAVSLLALNWLSLGKPRHAALALFSSFAIWTILIFLLGAVFSPGQMKTYGSISIFALIQVIVSGGLIFWQVRLQKPAYDQAVERSGKPSEWGCFNVTLAVAALFMGGVISNSWSRAFDKTAPASLISLEPTYADESLTFKYPYGWATIPAERDPCTDVEKAGIQCWFAGSQQPPGAMILMRNKDAFGFLVTLEGLSGRDIEAIEGDRDDLEATRLTFKIDGRNAIKYQYHYQSEQGGPRVGTVLYLGENNDWIRLYIHTTPETVDLADKIVDSFHFVTPASDN